MTYNYYGSGKCNPANWYNGTDYTDLTWTQGRRLSSITKHLTGGVRTYDYAYDMSGVRSSKTIEITVDGVLRNRRYDYITQNGKVVRETAYYQIKICGYAHSYLTGFGTTWQYYERTIIMHQNGDKEWELLHEDYYWGERR